MKVIKADLGITTLEHDDIKFKVFDTAISFKEAVIGFYLDKDGKEQTVMENSIYGLQIIETINNYYKKKWGCKK